MNKDNYGLLSKHSIVQPIIYRLKHCAENSNSLSECHLNPYRMRMDIICIFSHKIALDVSFTTKKHINEISQPPLQTTECEYGVRSELYLTLKLNRGVREVNDI